MERKSLNRKRKFESNKKFKNLYPHFLQCIYQSYEKYISHSLNTEITGSDSIYLRINYFFIFLANNNSDSTLNLVKQINRFGYMEINYLYWQFALDSYREYILKTFGKGVNANNYLACISSFLKYSASDGLCPHGLRLKGFSLPFKLSKSMINNNKSSGFTLADTDRIIEELGLEGNHEQLKSILSSIVNSTGKEIKSIDDLIRGTCDFLSDNLKLIRINAEVRLKRIIIKHLIAIRSAKKKENIKLASKIKHLLKLRDDVLYSEFYKGKELKAIRTEIKECGKDGVSAYIFHYHEGISPRCVSESNDRTPYHNKRLYGYLSSICKEIGFSLLDDINDNFNLHSEAQILAQCILYVDTSNNETSIRFLDAECLIESGGVYHLVDNKNRANMTKRPLFSCDLDPNESRTDSLIFGKELKLSVPKVINYLKSATSSYRKYTKKQYQNRLFLTLYKNKTFNNNGYFHAPLSGVYTAKLFASIISELTFGAVKVSPNMIRPSSLLLTALVTKDPIRVMKQGRHTSISSVMAYLKHMALIFNYELDIRTFQNVLEAMVTLNIDEFVDYVGIDRADYLASTIQAKQILKNQFGGAFCKDPSNGPYTTNGAICNQVQHCPICTNRRLVLVASKYSILQTLMWDEALEKALERFGEKEMSKWLLWNAFNKYALAEYKQNRDVSYELLSAKVLFEKLQINPYFKVFNL